MHAVALWVLLTLTPQTGDFNKMYFPDQASCQLMQRKVNGMVETAKNTLARADIEHAIVTPPSECFAISIMPIQPVQ
jgi:hypothetical protein